MSGHGRRSRVHVPESCPRPTSLAWAAAASHIWPQSAAAPAAQPLATGLPLISSPLGAQENFYFGSLRYTNCAVGGTVVLY
jgi:hypothetical protein